ncbi:hypothetical protein KGM_202387A, partial [Danaus plexippus plexippus]
MALAIRTLLPGLGLLQ